MADRTMTPKEMEAFLDQPHIAHLATLKGDGSPHLAPLWYQYIEGKVYILTGASYVKTRNIQRDSRVALSIATAEEPYEYVLIEGRAEITTDDLESVVPSICIRYWGRERGARFAQELLEEGDNVLIVVHPTKVVTWAYGGEY